MLRDGQLHPQLVGRVVEDPLVEVLATELFALDAAQSRRIFCVAASGLAAALDAPPCQHQQSCTLKCHREQAARKDSNRHRSTTDPRRRPSRLFCDLL
jgi:hypothetical protein